MSIPVNPLDQYRSYSYQNFILCANNSEALRQLTSGQISYSNLARLKHGEQAGGGVVMIANSTVDAVYSVDNIKTNIIYGEASTPGKILAQTTTIEFQIKEVGGATFLNFLNNVLDVSMQASINSCTFLLCTFFVGHTFQGKIEALPQMSVIPFIIIKMDSSFDYTGGVHSVTAAAATSGDSFMSPSKMYLSRNLNLASDKSTLSGMIKDFESKINLQLKNQFTTVNKSTGGNGRLVQYQFNIPDEWKSYTMITLSKDNFIEPLFQKQGSNGSSPQSPVKPADAASKATVNTGPKVSILDVLNNMIKHCPQVLKNFTDGNQTQNSNQAQAQPVNGLRQIWNFQTTTTSDASSITIHVDVIIKYLPILSTTQNSNSSTAKQSGLTGTVNEWNQSISTSKASSTVTNTTPNLSPSQQKASSAPTQDQLDAQASQYGIIFDFIFTGANSDILTMQINAENTNILFQTNSPSIPSALQNAVQLAQASPSQVTNSNKDTTPLNALRKNDAVFLPFISGEGTQGYPSASPSLAQASEAFKNMLSMLVAVATMKSKIVIRGNPVFLHQTSASTIPVHDNNQYTQDLQKAQATAKQKAQSLVGQYDASKSTSYLSEDPRFIPIFCKINLKTPIYDSTTGGVKYVNYWYQDWYHILTIDHIFSNGDFTQELQVLPYSNFESSKTPTSGT